MVGNATRSRQELRYGCSAAARPARAAPVRPRVGVPFFRARHPVRKGVFRCWMRVSALEAFRKEAARSAMLLAASQPNAPGALPGPGRYAHAGVSSPVRLAGAYGLVSGGAKAHPCKGALPVSGLFFLDFAPGTAGLPLALLRVRFGTPCVVFDAHLPLCCLKCTKPARACIAGFGYKKRDFLRSPRIFWWSWGELNSRPLECHSSALPTELQPLRSKWILPKTPHFVNISTPCPP